MRNSVPKDVAALTVKVVVIAEALLVVASRETEWGY